MDRLTQALEGGDFINITSNDAHAVIYCGDFNTEPGDLPHLILTKYYGLKDSHNSSKEKLHKLDEIDRIKQERETSLNDLESFILNIREKMYEDLYEKSSTEEEREKITEKVKHI